MREVDRLMIEEMGIELLQMMENAGRTFAQHTRQVLGGDPRGRRVVVLTGSGGNGGGGMAAGRRLSIWGAKVSPVLDHARNDVHGVPAHQPGIVDRLGMSGWAWRWERSSRHQTSSGWTRRAEVNDE
jgi:NAD(P)H-hydrate epimerase